MAGQRTRPSGWIKAFRIPVLLLVIGAVVGTVATRLVDRLLTVPDPLVVALFSTPAPPVTTPVPGAPEGSEVKNTHKKPAPATTTQHAGARSTVTAGNSNTVVPASSNTVITGKNNTVNLSPASTTTALDEDVLLSLANLAKGASDIQQHFIEQNDADLILKERSAWLSSASDYVKQSVSASAAIRFQNAPAAKGCPLDHPVDGCGAYRDLEGKKRFLLNLK